jgi:hypothetical protein
LAVEKDALLPTEIVMLGICVVLVIVQLFLK